MTEIEIRETEAFKAWLHGLRDSQAKARIAARIQRLKFGNYGDVRPIGGSVSELRIHFGPGYRVYFAERGRVVVVLLCGGDKDTQERDIAEQGSWRWRLNDQTEDASI